MKWWHFLLAGGVLLALSRPKLTATILGPVQGPDCLCFTADGLPMPCPPGMQCGSTLPPVLTDNATISAGVAGYRRSRFSRRY